MPRSESEEVRSARALIAHKRSLPPPDCFDLAERLREDNHIGYARRVYAIGLEGAPEPGLRSEMTIKLALCTYKDPDLPIDERLKNAEGMLTELLEKADGLGTDQKQESLGILGGISKQRWAVYGHKDHLKKSLDYYRRGYALGIAVDFGYTALNTAFVLDLLGDTERSADPATSQAAETRAKEAADIRREIVSVLPGLVRESPSLEDEWWFDCTLGEAHLGLREYEQASGYVRKAVVQKRENWRLEATARQMAHIVRMQAKADGLTAERWGETKGFTVLQDLLAGDAQAAASFFLGKVGLALSGGGFRASLFHIGVLARLAELDMLRHIEVISCVSGGSILGAYYYLELRNLLQTKGDEKITRDDYINLVGRIERNFLEGVQRNIRTRMLLEPGSNWKVLTSRDSTTTDRLAELYERELYARVADDRKGAQKRYLQDLLVRPFGIAQDADFDPRFANWHRWNKVPILMLNATTLNTCHNWQFTATYMGEPPIRSLDIKIDGNDRLRRMYYEDAPSGYHRVRLGTAVAASACVPGLFDPLVFEDLYQQGYVTKLVDGGVYDNQGVASLREQDCTVLLISDACGQTGIEKEPTGGVLGVASRANNILMARSREEQFQLLSALTDAGLLRGVAYVHLKKDLDAEPVDWLGCQDPSMVPGAKDGELTSYGIRKDVQKLLAAVRTDLDSFSDVEADALMASGYRMMREEFGRCIEGFPISHEDGAAWRFRTIEDVIGSEAGGKAIEQVLRTLRVAHYQPFKAARLSGGLKAASFVGAGAVVAALGYGAYSVREREVPVGWLLGGAAGIGAFAGLAKAVLKRGLRNPNPLWQVGLAVPLVVLGQPLLKIFTGMIDPVYLRWGPKYRNGEAKKTPAPARQDERARAAGGAEVAP